MPFFVRAIHVGEYVLIKHAGRLTLEEYKESAVSGKILLNEHRWSRLLIDTCGVWNCVSFADVYFIIEFHRQAFTSARNAVVFPPGREDPARFAETVAENRGVGLKTFLDYDQAVDWLTKSST